MKVTIIGAGPIGCYAGHLFAKSGHDVSIYDKKKEIGKPIQCTGIVTNDFSKFGFDMDKFLINTIGQTEVNFPNGEKMLVNQKEFVVCRSKFDNYLANLAVSEGAKIFLQHSFVGKDVNGIVIKDLINNQEADVESDIVIAADGPLSLTAKAHGFSHGDRKFNYGIQAVVKGNFDSNIVRTFFGKDVCPGVFVWLVPESSTIARVGLATDKDQKHYFDKFMKDHDFEVLEMQAGTIPIYDPGQELQKDNCYLLGDAAGFVKATTLGGIIPGLKQAEILVDCLNSGKDYARELRSLRRRLKLHCGIRNVHEKFTDKDWQRLASCVSNPKVQEVFGSCSRENALKLLTKLVLKEPRMLYFGRYLKELL